MGIVYLVGAGPGDLKLVTVKGLEIIKNADTIVYDRLINKKLLSLAKKGAKLIYVGKKAGRHYKTQEEINKILEEEAKNVEIVVRLKGGDPILFGRGAEEFEYLKSKNIEVKIIPGITSAIAVPTYAGIPITHREVSSSVHIYTGHKEIDLRKNRGTSIFLMAGKNLNNLKKQLMKTYGKDTPCAIISNGTYNTQKTIRTTISNLPKNIPSPSLLIIGSVVNKNINWFENQKLFGKKILITREYSSEFDLLEEQGAIVYCIPTFKIIPKYENIKDFMKKIDNYKSIVFTSKNGVIFFFETLKMIKMDVRKIKADIAVVGEKTSKLLENYGIYPTLVGKTAKDIYDKITLPCATLTSNISTVPTHIYKITAYENIPILKNKTKLQKIINDKVDYVVFTSPSSFHYFRNMVTLTSEIICAIGATTKSEIEKRGYKVHITPKKATFEELSKEIILWEGKHEKTKKIEK
ncbi:uroporphyrin-III methyltransferase [Thermosipho melanesiensis]|uniref:uroporphyrinogen-III C-methyltransferase n=2 Tax=Thermosipho melanesiensis TaxID=46541 RepID=A6LKX1_THEM4|nr:uroporphyrinogen-III C-methyltransferase [Thermosipho melanesiensis]ABR30572.1 uroporphyrin-III C-methyltransferase [Thermosipho melanesiensis BI429]APT73720.1 uroporphyrin-III methyltransferase [Thermosipho melanesiensis]OOC35658.1 uroporphyrin-III methyltransferase [Thermosipho melanesiensis]OOC38957.1 uroporphyrin-III methyltransferase [Thermosipho melanesiensis]OOC39105.1 uroporphyrin-III methyltransferase [Thermosipho melanesiensis]